MIKTGSNWGRLFTFAAAVMVAHAAAARAADTVRLATGERLRVEIIEVTPEAVRFRHPILGDLKVPSFQVRIEPQPAGEGSTPAESGVPQTITVRPTPAAEVAPPEIPDVVGPPTPTDSPRPSVPERDAPGAWRGGVEGGISGSVGNTELTSLRFGLSAKRQTEITETSLYAAVVHASDQSETTASRADMAAQNDWLYRNSPWGFFVRGQAEYDEFQDWDWRLSSYAGPSYALIRDSRTTLRARVGAGASYEIGGQEEKLVPEGFLGMDLAHRLTERQQLYVIADYLPSLSAFPQFRVEAKAGWRILIDPETKMSLHIGVADRYDSSPGPDKDRSDFDYFMTIGWQF